MPTIPAGVRGAAITGWGTALPPKVLTNADLEQMFDTNDEWIVDRTGIRERHVGGTTAGLSAESGRKALDMAGVDPASIDALVLATTTPDRCVPATSATVGGVGQSGHEILGSNPTFKKFNPCKRTYLAHSQWSWNYYLI